MATGATGVRGLQGLQGPLGPRGPTGITGWTQQNIMNVYGNNPTGPNAGMGQLAIASVSSGGTISLSSPGKIYQITGSSATLTTTTTTAGTFYIVQNTSGATCTITYPSGTPTGGSLSMTPGQTTTFFFVSTNNLLTF